MAAFLHFPWSPFLRQKVIERITRIATNVLPKFPIKSFLHVLNRNHRFDITTFLSPGLNLVNITEVFTIASYPLHLYAKCKKRHNERVEEEMQIVLAITVVVAYPYDIHSTVCFLHYKILKMLIPIVGITCITKVYTYSKSLLAMESCTNTCHQSHILPRVHKDYWHMGLTKENNSHIDIVYWTSYCNIYDTFTKASTSTGKHCLQLLLTLSFHFLVHVEQHLAFIYMYSIFKMADTTNTCMLPTRLVSCTYFWAHKQDTSCNVVM